MIEVNLLPGAKKRARRSGIGGGASRLKAVKLPDFDRWLAFIVLAWVLGIGGLAWMFFGSRSKAAALTEQVDAAAADSTRYAGIINQTNTLRAQRDTIAQKLEVIQDIDEGRYVWPHIMEELSRSLPDYTWLTGITQLEGGDTPSLQVEGLTGNNFALTRFMSTLEASPFLRGVRLLSTTRVSEGDVSLHAFTLELAYEQPPSQLIRTVPLFAQEDEDNGSGTD